MPQHRAISPPASRPPFGLDAGDVNRRGSKWVRQLLVPLLVGGPLVAAALGWLGGGGAEVSTAHGPDATMSVETARVLRSGNWFETRVAVKPKRDIADLAISIDQSLWQDLSVDTAIPDAESVEALNGRFTYRFGAVKGGDRFLFKLDGQIQPRGMRRLAGTIVARDGERALASVPLTIQVLP